MREFKRWIPLACFLMAGRAEAADGLSGSPGGPKWGRRLAAELRRSGFMNEMKPLFDLDSPEVLSAYTASARETTAHATSRDTTSWKEIQDSVSKHLSQHGDGTLVVLCGAAFHIHGAIPDLEQSASLRYLSTTPIKLDLEDVRIDDPNRPADKTLGTLRLQMDRANGVAKTLGYRDLLAFMEARARFTEGRNIAVGIEETGLHSIYLRQKGRSQRRLYSVLKAFLKKSPPKSILFIRENFSAGEMEARFTETDMKAFQAADRSRISPGPERVPWEDFLIFAKGLGIPISFGAFGIVDRENEGPLDATVVREIQAARMEIIRLDKKNSEGEVLEPR